MEEVNFLNFTLPFTSYCFFFFFLGSSPLRRTSRPSAARSVPHSNNLVQKKLLLQIAIDTDPNINQFTKRYSKVNQLT